MIQSREIHFLAKMIKIEIILCIFIPVAINDRQNQYFSKNFEENFTNTCNI